MSVLRTNKLMTAAFATALFSGPALAQHWSYEGESKLQAGLNVMQLFPASKDYYRLTGSLTTPPCTKGVRWIVMKSPVTVSTGQVDQFAKAIGQPNNRPLQAVNARSVLR